MTIEVAEFVSEHTIELPLGIATSANSAKDICQALEIAGRRCTLTSA